MSDPALLIGEGSEASIRAKVRRRNPNVRQLIGGLSPDVESIVPVQLMAPAHEVEIVAEPDAYTLFRYTEAGEGAGDSWFPTLEEALHQAEFEFGIRREDWYRAASEPADAE